MFNRKRTKHDMSKQMSDIWCLVRTDTDGRLVSINLLIPHLHNNSCSWSMLCLNPKPTSDIPILSYPAWYGVTATDQIPQLHRMTIKQRLWKVPVSAVCQEGVVIVPADPTVRWRTENPNFPVKTQPSVIYVLERRLDVYREHKHS